MRRLHIDAKDDLILRLAHRDQPVQAVIELIWNSLDAEADDVNVVIERDAIDAVGRVRVADNGHGIPPEAIPSALSMVHVASVAQGGAVQLSCTAPPPRTARRTPFHGPLTYRLARR
jgi:hypothetical protein